MFYLRMNWDLRRVFAVELLGVGCKSHSLCIRAVLQVNFCNRFEYNCHHLSDMERKQEEGYMDWIAEEPNWKVDMQGQPEVAHTWTDAQELVGHTVAVRSAANTRETVAWVVSCRMFHMNCNLKLLSDARVAQQAGQLDIEQDCKADVN